MKNILIVGGTFDREGGRASSIVNKISEGVSKYSNIYDNNHNITLYNGGNVEELPGILESVKEQNIVFWMPNVSNNEIKIRDVKSINHKVILINSKRNDNSKYTFAELIQRSLAAKANLTIEFSKGEDGIFNILLFDPLGNSFYEGSDIDKLCENLVKRMFKLTEFTRKPTIPADNTDNIEIPNEEEFFAFARNCSTIFHNLIRPAKDTERFLGNMSFRCQNGFPSFRGDNGLIFVSKRNVNKEEIQKDSFVPCYLDENENVRYYGENKPSVDTPVQLRLYEKFPEINYMIHAHCYVNTPEQPQIFTDNPVPCGAIEEVEEICKAMDKINPDRELFAINLIGHGCSIMAKSIGALMNLLEYKDSCFIQRSTPEKIKDI
jgi:hypothetical protein